MITFPFVKRRWRSVLLVVVGLAASAFLSGCASFRYYNVTDFDTVVVDPGHGGHDLGATSQGGRGRSRYRLQEKDLTLDVGRRLAAKLRDAGFRVILTRKDDRFIPLEDRSDCSNNYSKSVFISIHFNDSVRRSARGVEVYHNRRGTWQLAERIEDSLAAMPGAERRGVKTARFHVLRKSRGPALLVECAFVSNPGDAAHCLSAAWREETATRIAQAITAQRR